MTGPSTDASGRADGADPVVTVVVATHNRAAHLRQLLDALAAQTLPHELIVVDDDSPDDTPRLLAERGVRTIRSDRRGPGGARQLGWQASTTPIVAFTDDDCLPSPGWLEALVAPLRDGSADFAQGRTLPRPDQLDRSGPFGRTLRVEREDGLYQTCNIAYRREVLEEVGGFRASFTGPHTAGEDTDLAWRAKEAGRRSTFVPEALVHHEVWPSDWWTFVKDRRRWGMVVQVLEHHPELRRLVHRRWFYRPSHVRTLVLLATLTAAAFIAPWLPAAVLAAAVLAYVVRTTGRGAPAHHRALHILQVLVADVVEVAVFVRASVRYRTLLL